MVCFHTNEVARRRIKNPLPKPTHCHQCGSPNIALRTNDVLYGTIQGKWPILWFCGDCSAAVSCHPNTEVPVGFMADRETRRYRRLVHRAFDPLWKGRHAIPRDEAYKWLARQMGLDPCVCHVSYFDKPMCLQALEILTNLRKGKIRL